MSLPTINSPWLTKPVPKVYLNLKLPRYYHARRRWFRLMWQADTFACESPPSTLKLGKPRAMEIGDGIWQVEYPFEVVRQ